MEKNNILNSVKIIHSRRARHLRISINPEKEISLTVPRRVSEEQGIKFLKSKIGWIEKALAKIKPRRAGKWEYKFFDGSQIFFFGLPHRLHFFDECTYPYIRQMQNSNLKMKNDKSKLIINNIRSNPFEILAPHLRPSRVEAERLGREESMMLGRENPKVHQKDELQIVTPPKKSRLENFLSNKLREHIYGFAFAFCKENGFKFRDLKIKNIVSRWGSCSRVGNLNFSVRLVHYEHEVINYVVIHELCHTKEMNHSRRFWALVALYCPNFKTYIQMLK